MDEKDKLDLTSTVLLLSKSHPSGPQMNTNIPKNIQKKIDTPNRILPLPRNYSYKTSGFHLFRKSAQPKPKPSPAQPSPKA